MADDSIETPAKPGTYRPGVVTGARVALAHITETAREPCYAITFRHPPLSDRTLAFASRGRDQLIDALGSAPIGHLVTRVAGSDMAAFDAGMAAFQQASSGMGSAANAGNINDHATPSMVAEVSASPTSNGLVLVSGRLHEGSTFDIILPPHVVPLLIGMLLD